MTELEIHDEIMTPGCPQCAYKHLSSALSYLADRGSLIVAEHEILIARAKVNLAECAMGYHRHFPLAIGLMERAETAAVAAGFHVVAEAVRNVRIKLIAGGEKMVPFAIDAMSGDACTVDNGAMMWAHITEATREYRFANPVSASEDSIVSALAEIRRDYFDLPDEQPEKGGE